MPKIPDKQVTKNIIEGALIFILGGFIQVSLGCNTCWSDPKTFTIVFSYSGSLWLLLWKGSDYLVGLLDRWVSWLKFPVQRLVVSIVGVCALVYMTTFFVHFIFNFFVYETPLNDIAGKFSFTDSAGALVITVTINIFMHGRGFLMNWKQAAIDIERMKTEQVSSQYESLKNQVNPHFLFNSLNALSSLVYDDQKKAIQFIRKLSEVYRYVLDKKDQEVVSINEEMGFAEAFIFLQKIRFGDNLSIAIEGENREGYVPPLAIQLLVENAIKHNIVSEVKPLEILLKIDSNKITISNFIQKKKAKDSTGIGLENLRARYHYLSNEPMTVEDDGRVFKVTLPILDLRT